MNPLVPEAAAAAPERTPDPRCICPDGTNVDYCIEGTIYGPCEDPECYGNCADMGTCDCPIHDTDPDHGTP